MQESRCNVTTQRNFKALVREHMQETGLKYTAARAELLARRETEFERRKNDALVQHLTIVKRFYNGSEFTAWPAKRITRAHTLLFLVNFFEPQQVYQEKEINQILGALWSDYAFLRRELVEYGYLDRTSTGQYWLAQELDSRIGTVLHSEAPEWEELWLPDYLAGRAEKVQ